MELTAGSLSGLGISQENYAFLQAQVYRDSGIVLDETKSYLMEARLAPILTELRLATLDQLCKLLKTRPQDQLRQRVVEAMTTNETLFFRDSNAFEVIQNSILPSLLQARAGTRKLSIWSAAASTGQEAYSLAMILHEMGLADWDLHVLGTDLNTQVLDRARAGRYMQIEVNRGLPARYLVKYFHRQGLEWQLSDELRSKVEFAQCDLRSNLAGLGTFDLVLCRNVLIYFDLETKRKILFEMRKVLRPGAYVLFGCAESIFDVDAGLKPVTQGGAIFYQVP